ATAEDDQPLAFERADVLHPVENSAALEGLGALYADPPRLKRADPAGNHHGAGIEARTGGRGDGESPVLTARELGHLLPEMQLRLERLDLLHQPVHQLLRAADGERRNVVDGLVGVELGALSARVSERIDHMGADAEQTQLEHLEQAAGPRPDDDYFGRDRLAGRC